MRACACSYALAKTDGLAVRKISAIPGPGFLCVRAWGKRVQNHSKPVCGMGKRWQILRLSRLRKAVTWAPQSTPCVQEKSINYAQQILPAAHKISRAVHRDV